MNKIERNICLQNLKETYKDKENYVFILGFKSVSDEKLTLFRRDLYSKGKLKASVIKNSINKKAISGNNFSCIESFLQDQNIFVITKDPISAASVIKSHIKNKDKFLQFKTISFGGKNYGKDYLEALGSVSGIEELRSRLLGVLSAPMSSLLYILSQKQELFGKENNSEGC